MDGTYLNLLLGCVNAAAGDLQAKEIANLFQSAAMAVMTDHSVKVSDRVSQLGVQLGGFAAPQVDEHRRRLGYLVTWMTTRDLGS